MLVWRTSGGKYSMSSNEEQIHVQDEFFEAFDELWGPIVHEMHPVTLPEESILIPLLLPKPLPNNIAA